MDTKPHSQTYQEFIADHPSLSNASLQTQFESYARGQKADVNEATYQELLELLRKFHIWQMY